MELLLKNSSNVLNVSHLGQQFVMDVNDSLCIKYNATTNLTNECFITDTELLSPIRIISVIIMILITVTSLFGNLSVTIVMLWTPSLRNQLFVINLCLIDLIASVCILPIAIVNYITQTWIFSDLFCNLSGVISTLCMIVSIFSICAISIERFYSICWPMHHSGNMTVKRGIITLSIIWISSIILSMIPLFILSHYHYDYSKYMCTFSLDITYILILEIICFFIPVIIIVTMYFGLYRIAKQTASQVHPERLNNPVSSITKSTEGINETKSTKWRAVRTVFIIVIFFLVLWGPYFLIMLYASIIKTNNIRAYIHLILQWMAFVSYASNPFVYGLLNRAVREAFVSMYEQYCACEKDDAYDDPDVDGNEDFFQFLERTSTDKSRSLTGGKILTLTVKNPPIIEELESITQDEED